MDVVGVGGGKQRVSREESARWVKKKGSERGRELMLKDVFVGMPEVRGRCGDYGMPGQWAWVPQTRCYGYGVGEVDVRWM